VVSSESYLVEYLVGFLTSLLTVGKRSKSHTALSLFIIGVGGFPIHSRSRKS